MTWTVEREAKQWQWNKFDKKAERSSDFMWRFALAALITHGNWGLEWWVWVLWGLAILNMVAIGVYVWIRDKFE